MLNDLSKYITRSRVFERFSVGSLIKLMLECMESDDLSKEIMNSFRGNFVDLEYEGQDILMDVIWDVHMFDITGKEQTLITMMMDCFGMEWDGEYWVNDIADYYMRYTNEGRAMRGLEPDALSKYLEIEWPDFVNEFSQEMMYEKLQESFETFDDYEFRAMHIVVDIDNPYYYNISNLLYELGFREIEDGLFMTGCYNYICGDSVEPSFEWIKDDLIILLEELEPKRELTRRDLACLDNLNNNSSCLFKALSNMPKISANEILF